MGTAKDLDQERIKGRNVLTEITMKEDKIWKVKTEIAELEERLDELVNTTTGTAERSKQIESFVRGEKRQEKILQQDIERMQGKKLNLFDILKTVWLGCLSNFNFCTKKLYLCRIVVPNPTNLERPQG